jgi:hypothetical protein
MSRVKLLMLAAISINLGCSQTPTHRLALDAATTDILAGASRVEVFRTDGEGRYHPEKQKPGQMKIGGFPVIGKGHDQGKEFAGKLRDILFDDQLCTDLWVKCYLPGIAFRAWNDERCVDVIVCFKCNNLYCGPPAEWPMENAAFGGSPMRARLVELAKEALPDDRDIQAVK